MFKPGLTSITFRKETPSKIAALAKACGLQCIEWGGDIHLPAGENSTAAEVKQITLAAGLTTSSYGSYYKAGESGAEAFDAVLTSAATLGAPALRIWAGAKGSAEIPPETYARIADDLSAACQKAAKYGIEICLECHPNTLTDRFESSLNLLEHVNKNNLKMYWQPNQYENFEYNLEAARRLAPVCRHIHVFHWDTVQRYPLSDGKAVWLKYLDAFRKAGGEHALLLEFMHDDNPASLENASKTLLSLIKKFSE